MLDEHKSLQMLEGFGAHYNYDTAYMKEMLQVAPEAYETFEAFLPMASFFKVTPKDVLFVAKVAAMKNEDCAACLQLTVDMALEAGVDRDVIKEIVHNEGKNLSYTLKDIYDFTLSVAQNMPIENDLYDRIIQSYSPAVMMELALAIASTKVFPAIKRTLNQAQSCSVVDIRV